MTGGIRGGSIVADDVVEVGRRLDGVALDANDYFGEAAAFGGGDGVLVVGSYNDDTGGSDRGAVFVFDSAVEGVLATGDFEKDGTPTDGDSKLGEGTVSVSAVPTDLAGNVGSQVSSSFVYDVTAPGVAAGTPDLAVGDDTGSLDTDNITKTTTGLSFSGSLDGAAGSGEFVQLYNGGVAIAGATDSSFGGTPARDWDIGIDLSAGDHTIKAAVVDAAGNEGSLSSGLDVTVDTAAPVVTASSAGSLTGRTVKGVDAESGTTVWKYKVIDSGDTCGATEMATGSSDYTENTNQSVGAEADGKKVCFASTDVAGNVGYGATSVLSVAGEVPAGVWSPTDGSTGNDNTINVTVDFSEALYSDNACANVMTNTTADDRVKLGTTDGGDEVGYSASYDATNFTITMNPTNDLDDDVYYAEISGRVVLRGRGVRAGGFVKGVVYY